MTDEERFGGFDAGEQGDETFMLDRLDEYPGVMPELDYMEAAVIPAEDDKASLLDDPSDPLDESEEIDGEEDSEQVSDEELEEYKQSFDEESNEPLEEEPVELDEPVQEKPEELSIEDDELKQLVQAELDRSKKIKEQKSNSPFEESFYEGNQTPSDDDIEHVPEFFEPVSEDADEIEISEIDIDKPSTIDVKKINKEIPKEIDEPEEGEKTKKNKKTPFFTTRRVLAFSALLAALLISLIVFFYEDIVTKNKLDIAMFEQFEEKQPKKKKIKVENEKPERTALELDMLEKINNNIEKSPVDFVMEVPEDLTIVNDTNKTKDDFVFNREPIQEEKKIQKPKKRKTKKNKIVEKPKVKNKIPLKKGPSKEGTFTVQIISTPSYDDAKDWLEKLYKRGINTGSISEKLVRDKTWYRVRFGNFSTYEKASDALNKAGFDGSWVDRIK